MFHAAGEIDERDLGRTEQHRVDLVEVAVVPLEDLHKRLTVVGRRRAGDLRTKLCDSGRAGIQPLCLDDARDHSAAFRPPSDRVFDCGAYAYMPTIDKSSLAGEPGEFHSSTEK